VKKEYCPTKRKLLFTCVLTAMASSAVVAQDVGIIEEVVVTGSLIRGVPLDAPSPVTVVDRAAIEQQGAAGIWDVIKNLNINQGSTTNTNGSSGNGISGATSNINLRNLGTNSTLTLVNGKRVTPVAGVTLDGSEFVDLNTIPIIMTDRIEVLTDGGSALYGSDAVAGVVNIIMRTDFEGLELYADAQQIAGEGSTLDQTLSGIWGWASNDQRTHLVLAGEYFERDAVAASAASNFGSNSQVIENNTKIIPVPSFGFSVNPAYINQPLTDLKASAGRSGTEYTDPLCSQLGLQTSTRNSRDINPDSGCYDNVSDFEYLLAAQERTSVMLSFDHQLNDNVSFYSMLNVSDQDTNRSDDGTVNVVGIGPFHLPSFGTTTHPLGSSAQLGAFAAVAGNTIPTITNAPIDTANGGPGSPSFVEYISEFPRPGDQSFETTELRHESYQAGFEGDFEFMDRDMRFDVSYAWSRSDVFREDRSFQRDRMELAANGLGGPNCTPNGISNFNLDSETYWQYLGPTVFLVVAPSYPWNLRESVSQALTSSNQGQGGCEFFNPLLSSVTDPSLGNSTELLDWMSPIVPVSDRTNTLGVFDALVSGELMEMQGGMAAFAFGYQNRDFEQISRSYPLIEPGIPNAILNYGPGLTDVNETYYVSNDNNFGGFITRSFANTRNVDAVFTELSLPFLENIETQFAVRYEDYGGAIGSEVSPKAAISWRPIEELLVRASYSRSFRAPNMELIYVGRASAGQAFIDPLATQSVRSGLLPATVANGESERLVNFGVPSPNLGNETADTYSIGFIWEPSSGILEGSSVQMDFWRFDFSDRVVSEQPSSVVKEEVALFDAAVGNPANYVTQSSLDDGAPTPFEACDPNVVAATFGAGSDERLNCVVDPRLYMVPGIERKFADADLVSAELESVNAGNIVSDGVDIKLGYSWQSDYGDFRIGLDYTHVRQYEVSDLPGFDSGFNGTGVTDAAGTTGDGGATLQSLPDNRGYLTFNWNRDNHSFTAINRHIGSYQNLGYDSVLADGNTLITSLARKKVDAYQTWDVQYTYTHDWANDRFGTTVFSFGVLDLFEGDLPYIENGDLSTLNNFDLNTFDPRGRRIYARALLQF
jgi:iron complex outermembrane receptor protein